MPGPNNKVMHAAIRIGDSTIFVADTVTDKVAAASTETTFVPAYLHIYVDDVDATFQLAVENGAKVDMPLDDMFWGDRKTGKSPIRSASSGVWRRTKKM